MGSASLRAVRNWVRQSIFSKSFCRPARKLRCERLEDRHVPAALIGLDGTGLTLYRFDSATPGTTTSVAVTGLAAGESLIGIDYRPADGKLYGVAMNSVGDAGLYSINANTGTASLISVLAADPADLSDEYVGLSGTNFDIDFDPTVDRIRLMSDSGENLRINPDNASVITDDNLGPVASDIVGIAYTNNFAGAATTTLFGISFFDGQAYTFANPNDGKSTPTSAALGFDTESSIGFDISGARAFASLTTAGVSSLYSISMADGSATLVGAIGSSLTLRSLAFELDVTPPTVINMTKLDPDPNDTTTVRYLVTFSESVSGVDVADFAVATTGTIAGAAVNAVNYDDVTKQATVTITLTSGSGTLTMSLVDNDTIVNQAGIPLGGVGAGNGNFEGPTYTIIGNSPTATIDLKTGQPDPTNIQPVNFTVTFSEKVNGFASADIQITGTAGATTAKVTTTDSVTFNVEVSGATSGGTVIINFSAGAAQDEDGNDNVAPTIIDNTVTLIANQPPVITEPSSVTITENSNVVFSGANAITVTDPDAGSDTISFRVNAEKGTFTLASTTGLTFLDGSNGATVMTFTGTLANINAALNGAIYTPNGGTTGLVTVTFDADDDGHNGPGGKQTDTGVTSITINASTDVNEAPTITAPATATTTKNTQLTFTGPTGVSIADPDAGSGLVEISLSVTKGTLSIFNVVGLTFSTGDGTNDASMTFTGTLAKINQALGGLVFDPTTDFIGSDTLAINVDDQGNTGTGGAKTASANVTITVNAPTNTAPVANNDTFSTTRNQTLTIGAPGVLANDTDGQNDPLTAVLVTNVAANTGSVTLNSDGSFVYTPATNFVGTTSFTYKANDGKLDSNVATVTITVLGQAVTPLIATGAGPGGTSHVMVYNADGSVRFSFNAYDAAFAGGVAVATGDVDGDGIEDIITGAGAGGGPHVIVYSGANLQIITSFYAFDIGFAGGVSVAAGDITGDGRAEVIVGAGVGGAPLVKVFNAAGQAIQGIMAFDAGFLGGVSVAASDVDGDRLADIIVGAGPGGGPHVVVYKGGTSTLIQSFYAFDQAFAGGVNVAGGKFNNRPAIFAGAGPTGVPVVQVFDVATQQPAASFFAFDHGDSSDEETAAKNTGVKVGTEVAADGSTLILLGEGRTNEPLVRILEANTLNERRRFLAYDPSFLGGVFVG